MFVPEVFDLIRGEQGVDRRSIRIHARVGLHFALHMIALTPQQAFQLAQQNLRMGRLAEAESLCRDLLQRLPDFADALHLLGVIACQNGRFELAVESLDRAISIAPADASYYSNYGTALHALGRLGEAIAAHQTAIRLQPDMADAHYNLANALRDAARLEGAAAAYRAVVALRPDDGEAHCSLGNILTLQGRYEAAAEECREAIRLSPEFMPAYNNLAIALQGQGDPDGAAGVCRAALASSPNFAEAHHTLGCALKDQGQLDEAIAAFRQALAVRPADARMHSHLIYALHFHPDYDARAIATEAARWNNSHAAPLRQRIRPHDNDRNPGRRLKIGYVSPDFRDHVVGRNLAPLFRERDRDGFEVFCYSGVVQRDPTTERLRSQVDHWRDVAGFTDERLAEQIRDDRIDILVDLTLHMAGNRLRTFAWKPAPVQVTYLGYCGTTGVETMDFRLTDPWLDPPGSEMEGCYRERSVLLPETYWCYEPTPATPEVGAPPVVAMGFPTFGCLNNFCKVTPRVLAVWARLLRAVPSAQLMLHAYEGSHRDRVRRFFCAEGISAQRLSFFGAAPLAEYLARYGQIDVALDPFPYAGGVTTCDALWMGVPVISLTGRTAVGRGGLSILSNLGLAEFATDTEDSYIKAAVALVGDVPRLKALRHGLRDRMRASPLMDAPRFARHIEEAYLMMWQRWCEAGK